MQTNKVETYKGLYSEDTEVIISVQTEPEEKYILNGKELSKDEFISKIKGIESSELRVKVLEKDNLELQSLSDMISKRNASLREDVDIWRNLSNGQAELVIWQKNKIDQLESFTRHLANKLTVHISDEELKDMFCKWKEAEYGK